MSLQNLNPTATIDLEQLVTPLLPDIFDAVRWACLRYQRHSCRDELDELSQQIILRLIEDDCRRLHSFKCYSSFQTWLQIVANHYVYNYFHRRKQTESLDEVDQGSLIYSPPQDHDIEVAEKQMLLFMAIGKLSEQERLLYQLCYACEEDANKIASVFQIDISNVYIRKHKLVHKLTKLVRSLQRH